MKVSFLLLSCFLVSASFDVTAQRLPCDGKGNCEGGLGSPDSTYFDGSETGVGIHIPVLASSDPNEIIGPPGYDTTVKWVSSKATLPYKILFENDPDFATAPAQKVIIYMPIHPNHNPSALRISDFGFGPFIFSVPPNTAVYTQRLDVRDSLGVFVDITAGLDATNRRAFWIFESIDPATGLAGTLPAGSGFLPVNDSTHRGEGFVTLTIQAASSVSTRDSLTARASIIFDDNETIATNVASNLVDAVPPASKVSRLPALVDTTFTISWTGKDDSTGVGVQYYDLYVSRNSGPFGLYRARIDSTHITFSGERNARYSFYTLATDYTGNKEISKTSGDQTVTIAGTGLLVSVKAFLQGPYNAGAGLMTDSLRATAILPTTDPYPLIGFTHVNNATAAAVNNGLLDSVETKAITDWVWLELRSASNPAEIVATRSGLIRRDGSVVDMDGASPVYFNGIADGSYYVALRHRNHLGVMTATAIGLDDSLSTDIDFSSPATATFGTDARNNQNGVMLLWAGDANGDRQVRYSGQANDKNAVLSKVGLNTSNNILAIYERTDVNMDGKVRYNGAANDKNFILSVLGLATPNKVIIEQLPN